MVLAATGVLRGLQDTRTPLVVAVGGNALNVVLNVVLVYGVGPFAAWASPAPRSARSLAQVGMAAALRRGRGPRRPPATGAALRPHLAGHPAAARAGVAAGGPHPDPARRPAGHDVRRRRGLAADDDRRPVAAHQVALTLWTLLAFALDAVAIAAQAIIGRALGAGDVAGDPRADPADGAVGVWSAGWSPALAAGAVSPVLGRLFTPDPAVQQAARAGAARRRAGAAGGRRGLRARRRADRRRRRHATSPGPAWSRSCVYAPVGAARSAPRRRGAAGLRGSGWRSPACFMGARAS